MDKVIGFGKEIEGVVEGCSKGESRYNLHSVLFEGKYAISTDGHILIKAPLIEFDGEDLPADTEVSPPIEPVTIHKDTIKKALKVAPSKSSIPALNYTFISVKEDKVELISTDLDTVNKIEQRLEEINFPPVEEVIDSEGEKATLEISFMVDVLEKALTIARKLTGNRPTPLKFRLFDDVTGAYIRFQTDNGEALMVVMPCKG